MPDPIVAYLDFVGGVRRPIYDDGRRQYVVDEDAGQRVYGLWFIPLGECPEPLVVDGRPF